MGGMAGAGGGGGGSGSGVLVWLVVVVLAVALAGVIVYYVLKIHPKLGIESFERGEAKTTPRTTEGDGKTQLLDTHDVTCDPNGLQRFRLSRDGAGNSGYSYTCTKGVDLGAEQTKNTAFNDNGQGNNIFLDRHDVSCDPGSVLTRFKLTQNPDAAANQYRYDYSCRPLPKGELECRDVSSVPCHGWCAGDDGGGLSWFLDRHDVMCDSNEALSRFRLTRPTTATIGYNYKCCKVTKPTADS